MNKLFNWRDSLSKEKEQKSKTEKANNDFMIKLRKEFCDYCDSIGLEKPYIDDVHRFIRYCEFESKGSVTTITYEKEGISFCFWSRSDHIHIHGNDIDMKITGVIDLLTEDFISRNNLKFNR